MDLTFLQICDLVCMAVFAVTGALAAIEKRLDFGGCFLLAFVTGVGGGTLRDLLLDRSVFWIQDPLPVFVCAAAATITFVMTRQVVRLRVAMLWGDALGLALFSVVGAAVASDANASPLVAVMMGALTASGGGIIREVIRNEIPALLQREFYISAALAGAATLVALEAMDVPRGIAFGAGAVIAFALRAAGITFGWSLPVANPPENTDT